MLTNDRVPESLAAEIADKRSRVLARLSQPDAAKLSDRAIARELRVSQPFVGKLRRSLSPQLATSEQGGSCENADHNRSRSGVLGNRGASTDNEAVAGIHLTPMPLRMTTAAQALRRDHDERSPIGPCRRVSWPVEVEPEITDYDPFRGC